VGFIEGDHFDDEQCFTLLGRAQLGRIALSLRAVPVVFPVRYALNGGELLFTLSVEQLAKALDRSIATLQADGFEEDGGPRWTVLAAGTVQRVDGFESLGTEAASVAMSLTPDPASGELHSLFRLHPVILSGRWMETL
jgi:hypothetical protein